MPDRSRALIELAVSVTLMIASFAFVIWLTNRQSKQGKPDDDPPP